MDICSHGQKTLAFIQLQVGRRPTRRSLAQIIVLAALTLSCLPAPAQDASPSSLAKLRSYVPISEHIATSGQPTDNQFAEIGKAGYAVLINLSPPYVKLNDREGFLATAAGMSYVQIPVELKAPKMRDVEFFFSVVDANRDRKIFVHCESNLRTSVFVYLYRVIREGEDEAWARSALEQVWEPGGAWPAFIEAALKKYDRKQQR